MVTRPAVIAVICVGFFLIFQALVPKAMAVRNQNVGRFLMMDGHRMHKRKNYEEQRPADKESFENGFAYEVEPIDTDRNPEELSAFIVDYANMIRNDVILLDKSVETRTRKRGNIKVKKYTNPSCTCQHSVKIKDMGEDAFPRYIETRICNGIKSCEETYLCQENYYNLTILNILPRNSESTSRPVQGLMHWQQPIEVPISVGCSCSLEYVTKI